MRCADCNAWEINLDNKDFGICKAKAPQPSIGIIEPDADYRIIWPLTGKDDWCRQFQTREILDA